MPIPKYPDITVQLTAADASAFNILCKVCTALSDAKVPKAEIEAFIDQATASTYDRLLPTCREWVQIR